MTRRRKNGRRAEIVVSVCRNLFRSPCTLRSAGMKRPRTLCFPADSRHGRPHRFVAASFHGETGQGRKRVASFCRNWPAGELFAPCLRCRRAKSGNGRVNIGRLTALICGEQFNETDYAAQPPSWNRGGRAGYEKTKHTGPASRNLQENTKKDEVLRFLPAFSSSSRLPLSSIRRQTSPAICRFSVRAF